MTLLLIIWNQSRNEIFIFLRFSVLSALSLTYCYYLINNSVSDSDTSYEKIYHVVQFLLTIFVYCFAQFKSLKLSGPIVENTVHEIRSNLIRNLSKIELRDAEFIGASRINSVLSFDTLNISQVATPLAFTVQSFILSLLAFGYLGYISITGLIVTVVVSSFAIWIFLSHSKDVQNALSSAQEQASEMQEQVTALVDGFKELKLSEEKSGDAIAGAIDSSASAINYKLIAHNAVSRDFVTYQFSVFALLGSMAFILPIIGSETSDHVKQLVAAIMFLVSPLFGMIGTVPTILSANLAANNVIEFDSQLEAIISVGINKSNISQKDESQEVVNISNAPASDTIYDKISLENIRFEYDSTSGFSVGPLNMDIKRGELIFISGNNGSGKTTMLKLMVGLYRPTSGNILIDNRPIWPDRTSEYRNLFAVVFSDFYLFKKLYGVNTIDSEWTDVWLERLQLSHKITINEGKFSTTKLSTGQRKRLALFAALIEKKPFLILDEWAADQDPGYREFFYREILPCIRAENITVIAITHDESYFHLADRRLHLENGVFVQVYHN
jgi:putative pyoverdin transport system ATP-binding/permease protein